ncbi:hypothetical protein OAG51_02760 [Pirellulaceae bacterium]|jgi:hypothetical protein|nr:hypothetical protein [Pirellulaceae bacterium]
MLDIYLGIAIMIVVSSLFNSFTLIIVSRFRRRIADFFAILAMFGMIIYIAFLWDKAEITWFVPYSNAIIVGNWFPIVTAVLSALVYHRIRQKGIRKYAPVIVLNLVGIYAMLHPIIGDTPICENKVDEFGDALQSSQYTCSPTSGVNLLKCYSIPSTESEMATLCLTKKSRQWLGFAVSEGGTSWMGLYRGLLLKLRGTRWKAVFLSESFDEFAATPRSPLIISLKLPRELAKTDPDRYHILREEGWQPGLEHNVLFRGFSENRNSAFITDPKIGQDEIQMNDFRSLWVGRGMSIEDK